VVGPLIDCAVRVSESIIGARATEFASRILRLCDRLSERGPSARHVAAQLMRCGTSIGANAEEAQEGQTKPDYIAKMSLSRKEARETVWWLCLAVKNNLAALDEVKWELDEASQLLAMIRAAIKTARSSSNRGTGT
jgi:four helix bundle protein